MPGLHDAFDFSNALDWEERFYALGQDFLKISPAARATHLERLWVASKIRPQDVPYVLWLFRAAPALQEAVPGDLPNDVPLYRGVFAHDLPEARQKLEHLSWTLPAPLH